jgi:hypothetical protein
MRILRLLEAGMRNGGLKRIRECLPERKRLVEIPSARVMRNTDDDDASVMFAFALSKSSL